MEFLRTFRPSEDEYIYHISFYDIIPYAVISGDAGNNSLTGTTAADVISGLGGNDTIDGGLGNDTMDGGLGVDTLILQAIGGKADLLAGTHLSGATIEIILNFENAIGSVRSEEINGTAASNRLEGRGGNDSLFGVGGNDTLLGGDGNDLVNGGAGLDVMDGGAGIDTLGFSGPTSARINLATGTAISGGITESFSGFENVNGSSGADEIIGDGNNNSLSGAGGNDTILGGGGDDTVSGGAGTDSLDGGLGNDTLVLDAIGGKADLLNGIHTGASLTEVILNFENANGSERGEEINGTSANNRLEGNAGDDSLFGVEGNDTLLGGDGDDLINGGAGLDVLDGGAGSDTVGFSGRVGGSINLAAGIAVVGGVTETLFNFENVVGSFVVDTITGNAGNNLLDGRSGNDTLNGGAGNDSVSGGAGNDSVGGSDGDDLCFGGGGNDVMNAGSGNDFCDGGLGDDRFLIAGTGVNLEILDTGGIDTLDATGATGSLVLNLETGGTLMGRTISIAAGSTTSPLDLVFSQDLSGSFGDDIAMVQGLIGGIYAAVKSVAPDALVGVTSFVDKPIYPFGDPFYGDYAYQTDLALTVSAAALQSTYDSLVIRYGVDGPESQLEALMQSALREAEVGWRAASVRVEVLFTDATAHVAGDFLGVPANDLDAILDGTPPGTGEDYPAIDAVGSILAAAGIVPVFAVTSENIAFYQDIVDRWGYGAVVNLDGDSANIVQAVTDALEFATTAEIENVIGTGFADVIGGSALANSLDGRGGNDQLSGGDGNDTLIGGLGNDTLTGGLGTDRMTGGAGLDRFDFNTAVEAGLGSARDVVTDFLTGNDKVDLVDIDANTLIGGNQGFTFIGNAAAFTGVAQVRFLGGILYGNTDGDLAAELEIQLSTGVILGSDLLL